jgi:transcriptional regulator with XRE-family HTH domain
MATSLTFHDLQQRLLEELRLRVRSGAATERGLARLSGISQSHLHNVLKGKRVLSMEKADDVLRRLQIDILHLIDSEELRESSRRR